MTSPTRKAVIAFQRRFRPDLIDGIIDGECRAKLLALLLPMICEHARPLYEGLPGDRAAAAHASEARKVRAPRNNGAG